jgi:Ser/Thr protein kinase RdoA (MazF antagonist)
MGSRTWIIDCAGRRWVAKAVAPHLADQFEKGLQVAGLVEHAGIQSGAPWSTGSGSFTADTQDGCRVALLTWLPGVPLTGAEEWEQRLMGATLARVHTALHGRSVTGAQRFRWVDPAAPHLGLRSWLRPTVAAAVDARTDSERRPPARPSGLLHADPAPEAFRYDPASDRCGVTDWGSAVFGPLLYDVASGVMYLGGTGNAGPMLTALRGHSSPQGSPTACRSCSASAGESKLTTSQGVSPTTTSSASPGQKRMRRHWRTPGEPFSPTSSEDAYDQNPSPDFPA